LKEILWKDKIDSHLEEKYRLYAQDCTNNAGKVLGEIPCFAISI